MNPVDLNDPPDEQQRDAVKRPVMFWCPHVSGHVESCPLCPSGASKTWSSLLGEIAALKAEADALKANRHELCCRVQSLHETLEHEKAEAAPISRERDSLKTSLSKAIEERDAARGEAEDFRKAWAILREPDEALRHALTATEAAARFRSALDHTRRLLAESEAKVVALTKEKAEANMFSTEATVGEILTAVESALERGSEVEACDAITKMFLDGWDRPPAPRWPSELRADIRGLVIGALRRSGEHPSGFGWRQEVDALRGDLAKARARENQADIEREAVELRLEKVLGAFEATLVLSKDGGR